VKDSFYEELERVFDKFPKCHMKILLGDFNAKVDREDNFKPTLGNESLHEISNGNEVRLVNFATSENLRVKNTMFPHLNICKYTWTFPDEKIHKQIDHILTDKRRHSNVLDVRTYMAADCDSDHYLVVAKVAVNKQRSQISCGEVEVEGKEQYHVEVSNRFVALEDLDAEVEINSEMIIENIKTSAKESLGYYELKNHRPWFVKGCSELLDQKKQAKLQCLQDPREIIGDNLNNVGCEASRYFRNEKREYLKYKINEFAKNIEKKNTKDLYRGINKFRKSYQPSNNLVKDENVDCLQIPTLF
jgi:hypothetical protein